jgi:hypothetical protein
MAKKLTKKQKKTLKRVGWVAFGGAVLITARELYLAGGPRREQRRITYEEAKQRAEQLMRPLVVLGNPDAGLANRALGRTWQCGNVTIDPRGAVACEGPSETSIQGQPVDVLAQMPADSAVIYDSGLFAKSSRPHELATQMQRVSGGELFMVDAGPWTLAAFFEPGRKRRLYKLPPTDASIDWKPLPWHKKAEAGRASQHALSGTGVLLLERYE